MSHRIATGSHYASRNGILLLLLSITSYFNVSFAAPASSINRRAIVQRYNPTRLYFPNTNATVPQNAQSSASPSPFTTLPSTPLLLGTPHLAFPLDPTGLQSLSPFPILTSWGWKNDSLPPNRTLQDILNYKGAVLPDAGGVGRQYMFEDGEHEAVEMPDVMQWLISNPNRVNLGRVGVVLVDVDAKGGQAIREVTERMVTEATQTLDLWSGSATSTFTLNGEQVTVRTVVSEGSSFPADGNSDTNFKPIDTISIEVTSLLLTGRPKASSSSSGANTSSVTTRLGLFVDFPWSDGSQKFQAPFVGTFAANTTSMHQTVLTNFGAPAATGSGSSSSSSPVRAQITHTIGNSTFITSLASSALQISRDSSSAHRYTILPSNPSTNAPLQLSLSFHLPVAPLSPQATGSSSRTPDPSGLPSFTQSLARSTSTLAQYWSSGAFVDMVSSPGTTDPRAEELQRRAILSRYLMRINAGGGSAGIGDGGPQESGLVNNGWYGKFHMEMIFWHTAHFILWSPPSSGSSPLPSFYDPSKIYTRFLPTSLARSQIQQSFPFGARWSKMTDPTGRSAPGEINELLIWQQVHPIVMAEEEWGAVKGGALSEGPFTKLQTDVLHKWWPVIFHTAQWMTAYAQAGHNATTSLLDLGPPMYVVSEDTDPMATRNPSFELWEWRVGLRLAERWAQRMQRIGGLGIAGVGKDWVGKLKQGATDVSAAVAKNAVTTWSSVRKTLPRMPTGLAPAGCPSVGQGEQLVYQVYDGIPGDFWDMPSFTNDHPALVGLFGWMPSTVELSGGDDGNDTDSMVDLLIARRTMECVWQKWNISNMWGWDFGMLALGAARHSTLVTSSNSTADHDSLASQAIDFLTHPLFTFDDAGMPTGGARVPTPYWPGSGSLLYAVAAMAGGWMDTSSELGPAPGFPREGWDVKVEGIGRAL